MFPMATNRWWTPTNDLMTASRVIDRMFDQFFGYGTPLDQNEEGTPTYGLPVDVLESNDAFVLYASVPGIPKDNVDVTFEDGILTITAKPAPFERQGKWLRQERPWGNWSRKLELPKEVQPDKIRADIENGMLMVIVPKATTAQPVRIPVGGRSAKEQLKA
jgi:HSP20 family protein